MLTRNAARPRSDSRQYEFRLAEPMERAMERPVERPIAVMAQIHAPSRRSVTAWLCVVWSTVIVVEIALAWAAIALDILY